MQPLVDLVQRRAIPSGTQRLELLRCVLDLHRPLDELESGLDHLKLAWHQLFRLDEDVLAHTDLAEVVQETRVAQLLELVFGEPDLAVLARVDLGDRVGQSRGEALDAARVAGRGRVSLLDRGDAGLNESVEQRLN